MPKLSRRALLAAPATFAAAGFAPAGHAYLHAAGPGAQLPADRLRHDVDVLLDAYTSLHPGLYRTLTRAAYADQERRLRAFAARPHTLAETYLALSAFTASLRCGHSFLNPANQSPAIAAALYGGRDRLPFGFVWIGGRMIVTRDLGSGHAFAAGTEIVAIDHVAAPALLARMLPYARTDGSNDARKIADLGVPADSTPTSFDILRTLLCPPPADAGTVQVHARAGHRSPRVIECPLLNESARDASLALPSRSPPYGWRFETRAGAGVLTMPSWAVFHGKWDRRGFIDDRLDESIDRKLSGLVIDLRDNPGGLDCGDAILARLIDRPLRRTAYSRHVRYRAIPGRLAPYLTTWDRGFRDWGAAASGPDAQGFYTLHGGDGSPDVIAPAGRRYRGRVAVLISPRNASATFGFAALVKQHRLATLIGTATGGNLRGINGGAFFFVTLPASGLVVDLPLIAYWPQTPQPDRGVLPDLLVAPSAADIAAGRDRAMERALALITA